LDNGKEFTRFRDIEKGTGLAVYFADPYSAWQRGTNENTNGLLRRYFPKGSDFRNVTPEITCSRRENTESSTPQVPRLSDSS
jgi:IS30 family transposase